jgi:hypothetical protein
MNNKNKMYPWVSFLIVCLIFSFSSISCQARFAQLEEAAGQFDLLNREITVKVDTSEEIVESRVKILNEAGRETFGVFRTSFNQNIQKVEIIEAKTTHNGTDFQVPSQNIEIKPVASELNGFDQNMQVSVTFPNVLVGATVCLKYKITTLKQPLPNYFSQTFIFGGNGRVLAHYNTTIKSELPLHLMVNDPRQKLIVDNKKDGKAQIISIHLKDKTTLYEDLVNEPQNSFLSPDDSTVVNVSTFDKFEDFAKALVPSFEKEIEKPLPNLYKDIKEQAQQAKTLKDQINIVTSQLAEKVRYISDQTTIEGRFSPRSLDMTVQSAVGDCKDYSVATVAILRALGHKAYVVIVMRGDGYLMPKKLLPAIECANHAMVKVVGEGGEVLWIDPTNIVSMAGGIFPDIANRSAFVLNQEKPSYETIPNVDPLHAQSMFKTEVTLDQNMQHVKGTLTLKGEQALMIAGATLFTSEQVIKEGLIKSVSGETTPLNAVVTLPDLRVRIVPESLIVDYAYNQQNKLLRTNAGLGIAVNSNWGDAYSQAADDQEGILYVGTPVTLNRVKIIKNKVATGISALDFDIQTPWVHATRKCTVHDKDTIIEDNVVILKSFISASEVKSDEFKKLKELIKGYCQNVAVTFS